MNPTKKSILFLAFTIFLATQTQAQVFDDWEARPNVSLKYKFNKKLSIAGTYYLYLDKNMSQYDKSVIGGEIGYKINSWLKAGIDYRYGMKGQEHYHDIRYSITFDYNPSQKWKIAYRPLLQQEFISLKEEHLAVNPIEYYLRNRLTLSYEISNAVELYVFTENYLRANHGDYSFHRQKSALGAEFGVSPRSKIGARFEVLNKRNGKMIARPNLSYTYTLGYVKKR